MGGQETLDTTSVFTDEVDFDNTFTEVSHSLDWGSGYTASKR